MKRELDLRGVRCPLSWAKAKVLLETLSSGEEVTLILDDPKGVRDIPRAAEAEGYTVEDPEPSGVIWRLTVIV